MESYTPGGGQGTITPLCLRKGDSGRTGAQWKRFARRRAAPSARLTTQAYQKL